jgi:hypothetical protein
VATVRRNGRDTPLRCEIDEAEIECRGDERVAFITGDLLSISYTEVNTPDAA